MLIKKDIERFHQLRKHNNQLERSSRRLLKLVVALQFLIGVMNYFIGQYWLIPVNVLFGFTFYYFFLVKGSSYKIDNSRRFTYLEYALKNYTAMKKHGVDLYD